MLYSSRYSDLTVMRRLLQFLGGFTGLLFAFTSAAAESETTPYNITRDIYYVDETQPDRDLQSLDIYWQSEQDKLPVIIYVHGGGWLFGDKADIHRKPDYFLPRGIAVISMNYRLRWEYRIFDQLEDVTSVIVWVKNNAETYGLDASKIILMGHAAGAHLVSLVGTNHSYLKAVGLSLGDIVSVVAIDTASFDINRLMIELGSFIERRHHQLIFGGDEEVWRQSSPIHHVASGKNIPAFAILYVAQDEETKLQAMGFAKKLSAAEVETIMIPGNEKTAQSINEELGKKGDIYTLALMTFIRAKI
ncbi:MAG: alpha/beta hydrolase [Gammaproteobacteria bacterium]|nr:alpha/beta hydrolase [Gammaproteobacteria bacterium]